jgi:hypothetical protein
VPVYAPRVEIIRYGTLFFKGEFTDLKGLEVPELTEEDMSMF